MDLNAAYLEVRKGAAPGALEAVSRMPPQLEGVAAIVRPELVGVCGSDIRVVRNEKAHVPGVIGHEVVGRLAKVLSPHPGLEGISVGDRVTLNPVDADDESCLGYDGNGVLAERLYVSTRLVSQGRLFRIPPHTTAEQGVFAEQLACCVHGQLKVRPVVAGGVVAVVGAGSFGVAHVLLARHWGARRVSVHAPRSLRLEALVERGLVASSDVHEIGTNAGRPSPRRELADCVIVTANGASALKDALTLLRPGGVMLLFGALEAGEALSGLDVGALRRENGVAELCTPDGNYRMVGSYGTENADFTESVRLIATADLGLERSITHVVALSEIADALSQAVSGSVDGKPVLKMVVKF